ncbi:MAG: glycosyltransferase family 4 protein [Patescibacteria group bacterium]|nr:glycosyltransferase family 4 protein [Patescibacteria group bacterium]
MKTLLFTLEYPPFKGGVAEYYKNLIINWPESENIFVLDNNDGKLINNKLPLLKWLPAIWRLRDEVKKNKIEYVIVGNILPLGTAAFLLAKFSKIKYGIILHGTDIAYTRKNWRKKWLAKKILENAEHIICNSEFTQSIFMELGAKLKGKNIVVCPGVERSLGRDAERVIQIKNKYNLENKIVLFSIGRLIKRKGIDKVLEAMPEISKKISNLVYCIAGSGPDEEFLRKLAGSQKNVYFLGAISDEEKWAWLDLCDVFVQPTREEAGNFDGFGIVYLEANLAGKPVIAGRSGGVAEAIFDGVSGILVNPENILEIKEAISKLALDQDLRKKIGEQGKERAIKDFNWKDHVRNIYNFIQK